MQNPQFLVRHNFDDPSTSLVFNNQGRTGKGTEFPSRLYSQTSFEIYLKCKKWVDADVDNPVETAYDLTGMDSATILIKPAGTTITATQIGVGVIQGAATDGEVLFTVDSDLIPDNLSTYTSAANRTPISIYLILEDTVNDNKISLETAVEIMDIDRDGTENNSALDAAGINYNAIQPAKWTSRFNELPITLERALNLLALEQPSDKGKVISQLAAQPVSPTDGDKYLATATAGDWTENKIYEWSDNSIAWLEYTPVAGDEFYDTALGKRLRYDSSTWEVISVDDGTITTAKLADGAVTQAKLDAGFTLPANNVANTELAQMAQDTIKGRASSGTGDPEDLNSGQVRSMIAVSNVDNTSDLDKPVSTAQDIINQTKLDITSTAADSLKYSGIPLNTANIGNGKVVAYNSSNLENEYITPAAGGGGGGVALPFIFSTDITATDPSSGGIKANSATIGSITEIYVSYTSNNNVDATLRINSLVNNGFYIQQLDTDANFIEVNVTSVTNNTGWATLVVTLQSTGTLPANLATVGADFNFYSSSGISVASIFSRTGNVTAQVGDYAASQVNNDSSQPGATVADVLDNLGGGTMLAATYDPAAIVEQLVGLTATQALTNKTVNGVNPVNTGSGSLALFDDGTYKLPPGSSGGQSNALLSVGAGASLDAGKSNEDLQIKSIVGGTNTSINSSATELTINCTAISAVEEATDTNFTSKAIGDLQFWDGTDWVNLPSGTSGHVLKSTGVGSAPAYQAETGGGGFPTGNVPVTQTATPVIDASLGDTFDLGVLTMNVTLSWANLLQGQAITITYTIDAGGTFDVTFPASVTKLEGGDSDATASRYNAVYIKAVDGATEQHGAFSTDVASSNSLPRTLDINDTATGAYTLLSTDGGNLVTIDTGLTIPTGLPVGFQCSVFLDNATLQAITTTGLTVKGNANTNISGNGVIGVAIIATDTVLISGETE